MNKNMEKKWFIARGTTCISCSGVIERQALSAEGVKEAFFDFKLQEGYVIFDRTKTDIDSILSKIEEKGYACSILDKKSLSDGKNQPLSWIFLALGAIILFFFIFSLTEAINLPEISENMGYGLLFVIGLLTGFHCVAMCGGFVLSYTSNDTEKGKHSYSSHIMYSSGKLLSYTAIGALFGLLGSFIIFTPAMRGIAGVIAGLFLIIFGLKMLNLFPALRKFHINMPAFMSKYVHSKSNSHPLIIGLLNGLMIACGPLQAIYILAASTGSFLEGAKLLFIFGLGTLPVMLGFGFFASLVSARATHKILRFSGIVVVILGLFMVNNGIALTGSGYDIKSIIGSALYEKQIPGLISPSAPIQPNKIAVQKGSYQEIRMDVTAEGWSPDTFILKKGLPVKWIINGKEITTCNNAIQVPKLGLKFNIRPGEQIIEFTPMDSGTISWSCWMGMIPGTFIVKDEVDASTAQAVLDDVPIASLKPAHACGCKMS